MKISKREFEMIGRANLFALQSVGVFLIFGVLFGLGLISDWVAISCVMSFIGIKVYIDFSWWYKSTHNLD